MGSGSEDVQIGSQGGRTERGRGGDDLLVLAESQEREECLDDEDRSKRVDLERGHQVVLVTEAKRRGLYDGQLLLEMYSGRDDDAMSTYRSPKRALDLIPTPAFVQRTSIP